MAASTPGGKLEGGATAAPEACVRAPLKATKKYSPKERGITECEPTDPIIQTSSLSGNDRAVSAPDLQVEVCCGG